MVSEFEKTYSRMTDEELLRLQLEINSLVPDAQSALTTEMRRRSLTEHDAVVFSNGVRAAEDDDNEARWYGAERLESSRADTAQAWEIATKPDAPLPPRFPWWGLMILDVVSFRVFGLIWLFVQANYARKLDAGWLPFLLFALGTVGSIVGDIVAAKPDIEYIGVSLQLLCLLLVITGNFAVMRSIEKYYRIRLGRIRTFFLSPWYLQYHLNRIRRWQDAARQNAAAAAV